MGWRRRQAHNEMVVVKGCRHCRKTPGRNGKNLCQACKGSGRAKTVYWLFMGGTRRG